MAPLPRDNTACLFIDYTSMSLPHSIQLRVGLNPPPATLASVAAAFADVLKNLVRAADSFTAARYRAVHSNFSLPLPFTPVAGTAPNSGIWQEDPESAQLSFCGRGQTYGRRWRMEFFSPVKVGTVWPGDNRYNVGDSDVMDSIRTQIAALVQPGDDSENIVTIADDSITMYGYVNIRKNAYWQTRQR